MSEIVKTTNESTAKNPYDAIEDFAEMLEPLAVIMEDKELKELAKEKTVFRFVIMAIKKHKKEVLDFLCLYQDKTIDELKLTKQNLIPTFCDIITDQHIKQVFFS